MENKSSTIITSESNQINILIQGSAENPYNVTFKKTATTFTIKCDCPAGQKGIHCKHRFNILTGNIESVVAGFENLKTIQQWYKNTSIEKAILSVISAEEELSLAKKSLLQSKKQLSKAYNGKD